jgi:hypothetical protein
MTPKDVRVTRGSLITSTISILRLMETRPEGLAKIRQISPLLHIGLSVSHFVTISESPGLYEFLFLFLKMDTILR